MRLRAYWQRRQNFWPDSSSKKGSTLWTSFLCLLPAGPNGDWDCLLCGPAWGEWWPWFWWVVIGEVVTSLEVLDQLTDSGGLEGVKGDWNTKLKFSGLAAHGVCVDVTSGVRGSKVNGCSGSEGELSQGEECWLGIRLPEASGTGVRLNVTWWSLLCGVIWFGVERSCNPSLYTITNYWSRWHSSVDSYLLQSWV